MSCCYERLWGATQPSNEADLLPREGLRDITPRLWRIGAEYIPGSPPIEMSKKHRVCASAPIADSFSSFLKPVEAKGGKKSFSTGLIPVLVYSQTRGQYSEAETAFLLQDSVPVRTILDFTFSWRRCEDDNIIQASPGCIKSQEMKHTHTYICIFEGKCIIVYILVLIRIARYNLPGVYHCSRVRQ